MKRCSYCGKENGDDQHYCQGCGTELVTEEAPAAAEQLQPEPVAHMVPAGSAPSDEPVDISPIEMGYSLVEGFSRPDWRDIATSIKEHFPEENRSQAWCEVARKWFTQLREDLGGNYYCYESQNFFLL